MRWGSPGGSDVGCGLMDSVLVEMVVETETTESLRPERSAGELAESLRPISSPKLSRSSSTSSEEVEDVETRSPSSRPTSSSSGMSSGSSCSADVSYSAPGGPEMDVSTLVVYAVTASSEAEERAVIMLGPGKMWALMMFAHRTI